MARRETMRPCLDKALVERALELRPAIEGDPKHPLRAGDSAVLERLIAIGIDAVEQRSAGSLPLTLGPGESYSMTTGKVTKEG